VVPETLTMAKKKRKPGGLPEVLVVNGVRHRLCVCAVVGWDPKSGKIKQLQLVSRDEQVKLGDTPEDNVFVVGYIDENSLDMTLDEVKDAS